MGSHQVALFLFDIGFILVIAQGLGHLATKVHQPPVVGEIVAGVLLGPTLFGGALSGRLFTDDIRPLLSGIADVGVALFMFGVGLEIERRALSGRGRVPAAAGIGSTAIPFVLGTGLGYFLMFRHEAKNTAAFIVFIGLSVSVTAFPVLARILTDGRLSSTPLGSIALATAAVVDVVAWTALAGVQAAVGGGGGHWHVALMAPFVLVMLLAVRPALRRWMLRSHGSDGRASRRVPIVVLVGALLCGAATEAMDMHYIFGAFLFGLIMPREGTERLRGDISDHIDRVTSLLLPVYFVVAGLKVDLGGFGWAESAELGGILLVAVAGKFGGTFLGARTAGLPPRPAVALAALMNTRGLTELVILGVGLQAGLLDRNLYSLMVVMALVTTGMTGPLLARIYRKPVVVPRSTVARDRSAAPPRTDRGRAHDAGRAGGVP